MNRKHRSITSEQMFDHEMKDIIKAFGQKEDETTWEIFNNHFVSLHKWILEDAITEYTKFMKYLTDLKEPIKNSLMTKRTILSGNATKFLESISLKIPEEKFEGVNQMFIATIINIFGANNKVQRDRMLHSYKQIITNAKLPRMISKFSLLIINKKTRNNFDKMCILECLDTLIKVNNPDTIKPHHAEIEKMIMMSIESPQPESRILTRSIFQAYKKVLPEEWALFDESLTPQLKKTLNMPIPPPAKKKVSPSSSSAALLLKKKNALVTPSSLKRTSTTITTKATSETVTKDPLRKVTKTTITKPLLKTRTVVKKMQGQQQKAVEKIVQKKVGATTSASKTLKTKSSTNLGTTTTTTSPVAAKNNQESAGHEQTSESEVIKQEDEVELEQKSEQEIEQEHEHGQEKELLNQNEIMATIDSSSIEEVMETSERKEVEQDDEDKGELKLSVQVTATTENYKKKLDLATPPSSQDSTSTRSRQVSQDTLPSAMTPSHSTPSKKEYPINNATLDSRPSSCTPERPSKNTQSPTPSRSTSSPTVLVSNRTESIRKPTISANIPPSTATTITTTRTTKRPTKTISRSLFSSTSSSSSPSASFMKPGLKRQRSSTGSIASTASSTKSLPSRSSTGSIASTSKLLGSSRASRIPLKRSASTTAIAATNTMSKRAIIQERTKLNILKQKQKEKEKENIPPDAKKMKVGKETEQVKAPTRNPSLLDLYSKRRLGTSRSVSPTGFKKPVL